jgi:uncharacterized membrane protein (DUF485 family)
MATASAPARIDWRAIVDDPRFQALHTKKTRFLWGLMAFSVAYYFLLPLGAAYAPGLFAKRIAGPVNVGLVFALSEFVVAWGIAFVYSRRANAEFDHMAAELIRDAEKIGGRP